MLNVETWTFVERDKRKTQEVDKNVWNIAGEIRRDWIRKEICREETVIVYLVINVREIHIWFGHR
jgi:hypothetical protein